MGLDWQQAAVALLLCSGAGWDARLISAMSTPDAKPRNRWKKCSQENCINKTDLTQFTLFHTGCTLDACWGLISGGFSASHPLKSVTSLKAAGKNRQLPVDTLEDVQKFVKDFPSVYSKKNWKPGDSALKYSKKTCHFPQTSSAQITSFCWTTAMQACVKLLPRHTKCAGFWEGCAALK